MLKAARLLGLKVGGGGGPAVEALALKGDPTAVPLAVPMQVNDAASSCLWLVVVFACLFRKTIIRPRRPMLRPA